LHKITGNTTQVAVRPDQRRDLGKDGLLIGVVTYQIGKVPVEILLTGGALSFMDVRMAHYVRE